MSAIATINEYVFIYLSCICFHCKYCCSCSCSLTYVSFFWTVLYQQKRHWHVLYQDHWHHVVVLSKILKTSKWLTFEALLLKATSSLLSSKTAIAAERSLAITIAKWLPLQPLQEPITTAVATTTGTWSDNGNVNRDMQTTQPRNACNYNHNNGNHEIQRLYQHQQQQHHARHPQQQQHVKRHPHPPARSFDNTDLWTIERAEGWHGVGNDLDSGRCVDAK